jgi:hypothetical protein
MAFFLRAASFSFLPQFLPCTSGLPDIFKQKTNFGKIREYLAKKYVGKI